MANSASFRFKDQIENYPDDADLVSDFGGVYGLFDKRGRCIYVGRSDDDMEERLARHEDAPCIRRYKPIHYMYELSDQINCELSEREEELILAYKRRKQAPCNKRVG